jgi:hypothetical protein
LPAALHRAIRNTTSQEHWPLISAKPLTDRKMENEKSASVSEF